MYNKMYNIAFLSVSIFSTPPLSIGITSIGQIAQLVEQRTENPMASSNINDLAVITMYNNVQHSLKCTTNVQHN